MNAFEKFRTNVLIDMRADTMAVGFGIGRSTIHFIRDGAVISIMPMSFVAQYYHAHSVDEMVEKLEHDGFINTGVLST